MTISMLRHPLCAGQMRIERSFCTIVLKFGINVEYHLRDLPPVRSFLVRVEQSQVRYNVLLVVNRKDGIYRCYVGHVRI